MSGHQPPPLHHLLPQSPAHSSHKSQSENNKKPKLFFTLTLHMMIKLTAECLHTNQCLSPNSLSTEAPCVRTRQSTFAVTLLLYIVVFRGLFFTFFIAGRGTLLLFVLIILLRQVQFISRVPSDMISLHRIVAPSYWFS